MSYTKTTWVNNTTPINETNLNKIESGIKNNDINIGEENYDNTRTYEVGDIVRYNEKIYKCITAITTAENFDISKWEQTNIVEIVQSEKSKIYELIEAISTPIVGEGENITLNDTAEKRFENFDIEGNSEQATRSGKNLIDESNISEAASSEGIRYNGSYVYDNTPNSDSRGWTYDNCNYYLSLPAGTYTLSLNFRKKITNNVGGLFRFYKPDNTFIGNLSGFNVDYASVSFTLTETTNLGLYFKLMDGQVNIQLEEGSTATPYEQYGATPSPDYPSEVKSCGDNGSINEVICNKNLFDKNKIFSTSFYDQTGAIIQATSWKMFELIPKENTDYVLKVNNSSSNVVSIVGVNNDNSITVISDLKLLNKFNSKNYKKIRYSINNNDLDNCQLEEGTTATPYEEHQEQTYTIPTQQPMRSVGDTRDTFILKENGKWYERHYISRLILDGTENWSLSSNSVAFRIVNSDGIKASKMLSNYFVGTIYENLYNKSEDYGTALDNGYIYIRNKDISGVNDFKTLLSTLYNAGTPVYVDYVLKEPLDIECTEEQTEILNQMYIKAKSYKGVTHIHSNDEISPNCYVEAVKDLTTLIQ